MENIPGSDTIDQPVGSNFPWIFKFYGNQISDAIHGDDKEIFIIATGEMLTAAIFPSCFQSGNYTGQYNAPNLCLINTGHGKKRIIADSQFIGGTFTVRFKAPFSDKFVFAIQSGYCVRITHVNDKKHFSPVDSCLFQNFC
jgi:hypothetical protein